MAEIEQSLITKGFHQKKFLQTYCNWRKNDRKNYSYDEFK